MQWADDLPSREHDGRVVAEPLVVERSEAMYGVRHESGPLGRENQIIRNTNLPISFIIAASRYDSLAWSEEG